MVISLLRFVSFEGHRTVDSWWIRRPLHLSEHWFLAPSPWDRSVGGSALILLLLPDLSVSHDSIPQELRAVSTGALETQIW